MGLIKAGFFIQKGIAEQCGLLHPSEERELCCVCERAVCVAVPIGVGAEARVRRESFL